MIINVEVQSETFTIEVEAKNTVLQLKEKIFNELGPEYVVERQKLIHAGITLRDDQTIDSYNVDEKELFVIMLKRDVGSSAQKPDEGATSISSENPATTYGETSNKIPHDKKKNVWKSGGNGSSDEDTKSPGSGGSGGSDDSDGGGGAHAVLEPVGSNTSIFSTGSATSMLSRRSDGSDSSETSHSTYSSGDLAGVFSNTSLQSRTESNLRRGEEFNRTVDSMTELGYCRETVLRALAASFNNPERAVEYLISGIPDSAGFNAISTTFAAIGENVPKRNFTISNEDNNITGTTSTEQETVSRPRGGESACNQLPNPKASIDNSPTYSPAGGQQGPGAAGEGPFDFLRNHAQFVQMRTLVSEKPDMLNAVLQQIGHTNPALLQLICENQEAFLSMLNRPVEGQFVDADTNRRITPGRRAQLAAAARAAAGGDGFHVHALDTAPGAGGDGPTTREHPTDGGDAGADSILHEILSLRPDSAAERRRAITEAFMRERAAAAAAVAAILADPPAVPSADSSDTSAAFSHDTSSTASGNANIPATEAMSVSEPAVLERTADGQGSFVIHLSAEDEDAVKRLKSLGFTEALVINAYFACDKDEQLTANFLISISSDN